MQPVVSLRQLDGARCVALGHGGRLSGAVVPPAIRYPCLRAPTVVRVFSGSEFVPRNSPRQERGLSTRGAAVRPASPAIGGARGLDGAGTARTCGDRFESQST